MEETNCYINLFSVPIYKNIFSDISHNEVKNILPLLEFNEVFNNLNGTHKINSPLISDNHSPFDEDVISYFNLSNFEEELNEHLMKYCEHNKINHTKRYLRTSWVTSFSNGEYGHTHIHGKSDISGAYYISTNEEDGNIFFNNPVSAASYSVFQPDEIAHQFQPKEKQVLIFPSWLPHGISKNTTSNIRHSLSFNIYFK
jgi:uncharacterized protein (TIGR02466 family)